MKKIFPLLLLAVAGSSAALAQNAPINGVAYPAAAPADVLGTWEPVSINRALSGPGLTAGDAKLNVPTRIKYSKITRQEGGTFAGERYINDGKTEAFVGAFESDGRRFITASDAGSSGFGIVDGDLMESCFINISPGQHGVGCTIYRRTK